MLAVDIPGFGALRLRHLVLDYNGRLVVLGSAPQDRAKATYVRRLGASGTVCIGNGRNDRLMLRAAALGIAVILAEGASCDTLRAADVVVRDIRDALDLLIRPLRLAATLRS